jgi:hypothetical protein
MAATTTSWVSWALPLAAIAGAGILIFDSASKKVYPTALPPRSMPSPVKTSGRTEALYWLQNNPNKSRGFASNTFGKTSNAVNFVQRLYGFGATKVYVAGIHGEPWRIQEEGGPIADTLYVTVPSNPGDYIGIANFIMRSHERPDEFSRVSDHARIVQKISPPERRKQITPDQLRGGNTLRLWWD